MQLSVKNQTFFFVATVLFVASVVVTLFLNSQESKKLDASQEAYVKEIRHAYEKVLQRQEQFYASRIKANINSSGVKEALANGDKETLKKLIEGRWEVLRGENEYLESMRFYLPDSSLLLQVRKYPLVSYEVSGYSTMVRDVVAKKLPVHGFEEEANVLIYKIVYPVLYENRLLGSVEFSLNSEFFLKELYDLYKIQSALYVKESQMLQIADRLGKYYRKYTTLEEKNLTRALASDYAFAPYTTVESPQGDFVAVYNIDIQEYDTDTAAKLLCFVDFTAKKAELHERIGMLGFIFFGMSVIILILIYIMLNRNVKILEKKYESMSQYKKMIDEHVITATLDLHCNIVDVSEAFLEKTGYKKYFLIGKKYRFLGYPDVSNEIYEKMYKALRYKKNFQGEMKQAKENGELFWVSVNIQPKFQKNILIGYDVIMHDITDKKINEELMVTDGLTHLYNRRYFNDIFPRMIQGTKRDGGFLSFLLFDLDNFKLYNDTYGHQAGDHALIEVARVLKESLKRGYDYSFRLGGEEFGVLYKSSSEHDAYLFAQKIRKNIAALQIKHEKNGEEGVLTASFGLITLRDYDLTNDDDIYKQADEYLYRAKKEGRNKVVSRIL